MTDSLLQWADARVAEISAAITPAGRVFDPLAAEASYRSFYRYRLNPGQSYVVMASPPDKEQNRQFEALAEIFGAAGIPVPAILARDPANGWYLLEDLGETDLEHAYGTPNREPAIRAAIDWLVRLQVVNDPQIAPYTRNQLFNIISRGRVDLLLRRTENIRIPGDELMNIDLPVCHEREFIDMYKS